MVRKESEIELEAKNFSFLSFGNRYINYLRKSNETNWVSVEGKHFWYNNSRNSVRINSHLSHKLFWFNKEIIKICELSNYKTFLYNPSLFNVVKFELKMIKVQNLALFQINLIRLFKYLDSIKVLNANN